MKEPQSTAGRSWATALVAALVVSVAANAYLLVSRRGETDIPTTRGSKPYKDQIMAVLRPLRYTGLPALHHEPVRITANYPARTWRFENFREFDPEGRLILADGETGVCGELSAYVYRKILPIVRDTHDLKYVKVSRSDFFKFPLGGHIVLLLVPKDPSQSAWVIDPSFHLYERVSTLMEDYAFYQVMDHMPEIDRRETFVEYRVNAYMPLVIQHEQVIELGLADVGGKFDPENYALVLYVIRKGKYGGHRVLEIAMKNGQREVLEDKTRAERALGAKGYADLRARLFEHFDRLYARPAESLPLPRP